jgi:hypothetical protein
MVDCNYNSSFSFCYYSEPAFPKLLCYSLFINHLVATATVEDSRQKQKKIALQKGGSYVIRGTCLKTAVLCIPIGFNGDLDPAFYLNADSDPESQANAVPADQIWIRILVRL